MKFTDFSLDPELLDGIETLGFDDATPIQAQAIPIILDGKDLIACAQTGTGKTGAYLIPLIQKLRQKDSPYSRAMIVSPTRELAGQIDQNMEAISYFTGISSVAIFGGKDAKGFDSQKFAVTNGADVLIATPGRLIIHLALGYMNLEHVEMLILDEADKMLDMGFLPDILRIVSHLPEDRQTLMFSATMPNKIRTLAKKIMREPEEISLSISKPAAGINQLAYIVFDEQKIPILEHIVKTRDVDSMIIFASSKVSVDQITRRLKQLNYGVEAMHSDKSQQERTETLRKFKNKEFPIMVGTDVLARGIDIDSLSHVLNYDVPMDAEDYVHRVGRTARASSKGEAITLVSPRDMRRLGSIEQLIEADIPKPEVPEELGETPTYNPRGGRGRGGRGRGRNGGGGRRYGRNNGRRGQGGGRGGNRRRSHSGRNQNDRRENLDNRPPKEESAKSENNNQDSNSKPKKRRRRRRGPKKNTEQKQGGNTQN